MAHKRRVEDNRDRGRGGGDRRPRRRRKHLYVALDDWEHGFSIHRIDADTFDSDDDDEPSRGRRRHHHLYLPDPPVLQLESPAGSDWAHGAMSFSALGTTKLFAFMNQHCALVHDADTGALAVGPHAPAQMECGFGTYVRVGGEALYALTHDPSDNKNHFFVMSWGPTAPDALRRPTEGWSWTALPPPPPALNSRVASYAVHPDGCAIFMTTNHVGRMCTYSFNIKDSAWTWLGDWALPFLDQGHFDTELDAWIGLGYDGSICACQVVSPTCTTLPMKQEPDCKRTMEKLVSMLSDGFMTATLTYMGKSKFCLVQTLAREGEEGQSLGDHDGSVLRITMFGVKYNRKGELQTSNHHSTRSFVVSRHRDHFEPAVFWM